MIVLGTEPRRARPDSCECRPGKDTEITPKPSQAFRVVRNRHDSRQVFSQGIGIRDALQPEGDDAKSRQHDWKAGTAAIVTDAGPAQSIHRELPGVRLVSSDSRAEMRCEWLGMAG